MTKTKRKFQITVPKIVFSVVFVLLLILSIGILYPFYFCLNASLMDGAVTFMANRIAFPNPVKIGNYLTAFQQLNANGVSFLGMVFNSAWYAGLGALFSVLFTSMTTYVVCKYAFPGRNAIYSLVLVLMMVPIYGTLPAQYRLYSRLGMVNSPLILMAFCSGRGNFLIIYAFYKSVPWSYAEAAFIDGASDWKVFWKIMLPMVLPTVSAIYIIEFVGLWNDYETPILYLSRDFSTLASGLFTYEKKMAYKANHPVYFAGVIISLIPIIILFCLFQNTIMTKVNIGGLKG